MALVAVLPVGPVGVEGLLDEDQVVVAEAEAVEEGGAVLVPARYRGHDLQDTRSYTDAIAHINVSIDT